MALAAPGEEESGKYGIGSGEIIMAAAGISEININQRRRKWRWHK